MMRHYVFSKKSFLIIVVFFLLVVIEGSLGSASIVLTALSTSVVALQNIALIVGTITFQAAMHVAHSAFHDAMHHSVNVNNSVMQPVVQQDPLVLMGALEAARKAAIESLHAFEVKNFQSIPLQKVIEQRISNSQPGVYLALHKLLQVPEMSSASKVIVREATNQLTLAEARKAAQRVLQVTCPATSIAKQAMERLTLQSQLGLLNFNGLVLTAGKSADGRFTYYVGARAISSHKIMSDRLSSMWQLKQQIIQLLANDLEYREYVFRQYKQSIDWMLATNDASVMARTRARLMLAALIFEGNNWEEFYYTAHKLQTYFFNRDGSLCPIGRTNVVQPLMNKLLGVVRTHWPTIAHDIAPEKLALLPKGADVDNPWALWFAPNIAEFSKKIIQNPENQLLLKILDACEQGDIVRAEMLCRNARCDRMHNAAEIGKQIIQEVKGLLFDEWGITKIAHADPLYQQLSTAEKCSLVSNQCHLQDANDAFLIRHALKAKMQQAWSIPDSAAPCVHKALYALLDDNAIALHSMPLLIDKVMELTSQYKSPGHQDIVQALLMPNGVLRDFAAYDHLKTLRIPTTIMHEEHLDLRRMLNNLLYLEHALPNTACSRAASTIIEYIEKRFATSEHAVQQAYDRVINVLYQALMQRHETDLAPLAQRLKTVIATTDGIVFDIPCAQACDEAAAEGVKAIDVCPKPKAEASAAGCGTGTLIKIPDVIAAPPCDGENGIIPVPHGGTGVIQEPKPITECNYSKSWWLPGLDDDYVEIDTTPNPEPPQEQSNAVPAPEQEVGAIRIGQQPAEAEVEQPKAEPRPLPKVRKKIDVKKFLEGITDPAIRKILEDVIKKYNEKINKPHCKEHGKLLYNGKHILIPLGFDEVVPGPLAWEKLSKVFDGITTIEVEGEKIPVWIDYQHILTPVIKINCETGDIELSGFHHDHLEQIMNSGLLDIVSVERYADGTYKVI